MLLVFYFFAVIGLLFLKENDPQNFGSMFVRALPACPKRRACTAARQRLAVRRARCDG
jgi:hypothetical protein